MVYAIMSFLKRYRFPETRGLFETFDSHPPTKPLDDLPHKVKGVVHVDVSLAYMIRTNEICGIKMVGNNLMDQAMHQPALCTLYAKTADLRRT